MITTDMLKELRTINIKTMDFINSKNTDYLL